MSAPLLWGPNGAVNLQNQEILGNGQLISSDGVRNFVPAGSFENGTVGNFALGSVTLSGITPSTTISAGAASLTQSIVTGGAQLSGTYSMQVASAGTWTSGQGVYVPFTADASQQTRVQQISFAYSITSGTSNVTIANSGADTFAVGVYDVTNSVWLAVSPAQYGAIQGYKGTCNIQVQLSSNSTSYQLFFFAQNASAGAVTIIMDQVFVGPQAFDGYGVTMTDWVAYTPTISGFGTVSGINFQSRRVGDSLQVSGAFTTGTPTATVAQITIGYGGINGNIAVDITKCNANTNAGSYFSGNNSTYGGVILYPLTSSNYVGFGQTPGSGINPVATANGNQVTVNGMVVEVNFSVPIVGWSSNSQIVSQYDGRVVALRAAGTVTGGQSSGATIVFPVVGNDTHNGYNASTGVYTVPVTGYYNLTGNINATIAGVQIVAVVNGANYQTLGYTSAGNGAIAGLIYAVAGSTINLIVSSALGTVGSQNYFCLALASGAQNIQAGQRISAQYYQSASQSITANSTPWNFDTKIVDTTGAVTTGGSWKFTAPVSGDYQFSGCLQNTGTTCTLYYQINGSNSNARYVTALDGSLVRSFSVIVSMNAGDYFQLFSDTSITSSATISPRPSCTISVEQIAGAAGGGTTVITGGTGTSGITRSVSSVSASTTAGSAANTDYVYLVSGTTTLTLPTAVGNSNLYTVKNTGVNTVSIATTSSQTIDGSSSPITLPVANTSLDLISDGSNWRII
jgi:hypothetical protein